MPDAYWKRIEQAIDTISIYDGVDVLAAGMRKHPEDVQDLVAMHWFLSEFENGGIAQFFLNPTGVLAPEAVVGFVRIGLPEVADALQRCCLMFGSPYPREAENRESILLRLTNTEDPRDVMAAEPFATEERIIEGFGAQIYERMNSYEKKG